MFIFLMNFVAKMRQFLLDDRHDFNAKCWNRLHTHSNIRILACKKRRTLKLWNHKSRQYANLLNSFVPVTNFGDAQKSVFFCRLCRLMSLHKNPCSHFTICSAHIWKIPSRSIRENETSFSTLTNLLITSISVYRFSSWTTALYFHVYFEHRLEYGYTMISKFHWYHDVRRSKHISRRSE